uniref:ribonuclease H n=1 Tax=Esox lucius TaxID=8010 RepID=A0AAY5KSY6_ESOLU
MAAPIPTQTRGRGRVGCDIEWFVAYSMNTPILPVEKKGTGKYRMAHDLRAINNILLTPTIPVPNPYVALTYLTPDQKWFSCIDLANAFFCLPLAEELRDIFSFTHRGRQWRYTRLPQGFALSPGIFNQVLREALQGCCLPTGMLPADRGNFGPVRRRPAAGGPDGCILATMTVLTRLAEKGFKVSKEKLQLNSPTESENGGTCTRWTRTWPRRSGCC